MPSCREAVKPTVVHCFALTVRSLPSSFLSVLLETAFSAPALAFSPAHPLFLRLPVSLACPMVFPCLRRLCCSGKPPHGLPPHARAAADEFSHRNGDRAADDA
eukprot:2164780-Pleurochrysis_carterae.AAC.1